MSTNLGKKLMKNQLLNQMKRQEFASIQVSRGDGTTPEQYLKWISYIPKHWHVETILEKKASELNNDEITILKRLEKENKVKSYFENIVSSEKTKSESAYYAYLYMESINIHQYAKLKLTREELNDCHEQVSLLSDSISLKEKIEYLSLNKTNSILDDYILFLLKEKKRMLGLKKLDKEIQAQLLKPSKLNNNSFILCRKK